MIIDFIALPLDNSNYPNYDNNNTFNRGTLDKTVCLSKVMVDGLQWEVCPQLIGQNWLSKDNFVYFKVINRSVPSLERRKEGRKCLFNDALNTFYLRLYGVRHMVKYHSDSERKPAAATYTSLSD